MQIFSLLMQLFMSHIVSSLHLLKERIFVFMCNLIFFFFFKLGLCVFNFPHLLNFPQNCFPQNCFYQNLFCFSYFYRGRNLFLTFVALRGSCFLDSLFPLILCCVCFFVYSLIGLSLSIRDKKGEKQMKFGKGF